MGVKIPAKYPVKSLVKALRLLETLGRSPHGASVTALSKDLKIGKSTVHRLLATLREFDLSVVGSLSLELHLRNKYLTME